MKIVKLIPSNYSKFHIGDAYGELKEYFSSDQLFSTVINNVDLLYGKNIAEQTIDYFNNNNLIISSVFYGLEFYHKTKRKSKEIYFLPKPYWLIQTDGNEEFFTYDLLSLPVIGSKFAISKEEFEGLDIETDELNKIKIHDTYSMPKVSVNRLYGDSNNFYFDDITEIKYSELEKYTVKTFMYFVYFGEITKEIKAAINMIQDEGIGGKRSRGLGVFEKVEFDESKDKFKEELNRYINNSSKYYINISTVFPKIEEVNEILSYKLENRRGFIFSNGGHAYRKKSVRIIKEGSIFKAKINGMIEDITPKRFEKHKVWLYGKALLIGFGGEEL
jgi:CRISPR-associated protein Csm4